MIQRTVERMYTESEENRFLEVTYADGDKEVLYFKDFNSGAMIENIVARAKKMAIKEFLETGQKGMRVSHLLAACVDEFSENEDLPNTTNPATWTAPLATCSPGTSAAPAEQPCRAEPSTRQRGAGAVVPTRGGGGPGPEQIAAAGSREPRAPLSAMSSPRCSADGPTWR